MKDFGKENFMCGIGFFKYRNGDKYKGEFSLDKRNGKGRLEYSNGDVYEGHFKDNMRHGYGVQVYNGGLARYSGEWINDKREGKGDMTVYFKGTENIYMHYKGEWLGDNKHGSCELTINGIQYHGNFENDLRSGQGKLVDCNGTYTGTWRENERHGNGVFITPSGIKVQGEWRDDLKIGRAIATSKSEDGKVTTEYYLDGRLELTEQSHYSHAPSQSMLYNFGLVDLPEPKMWVLS